MKKLISAIITGGLFIGLIIMLRKYDVAPIGPEGTSVGFSTLNKAVHDLTGVHMLWYSITDWIGYGAIVICALFGALGIAQLIKRKSLLKVDRTLYALGAFYVVVIGSYVFFEKFIINYRPVIMPGASAPEASFPSSHTMLIITVMCSTMMVIGKYVKDKGARAVIRMICAVLILITVLGRLYCGVHWFTDIIGGILYSTTLLLLFSLVLRSARKADRKMLRSARAEKKRKSTDAAGNQP